MIDTAASIQETGLEVICFQKGKDRKLLFNPRHDFFSLDAGALN